MKDFEVLEVAHHQGWLNEKGLLYYIEYLKHNVSDLKQRREKALEEQCNKCEGTGIMYIGTKRTDCILCNGSGKATKE